MKKTLVDICKMVLNAFQWRTFLEHATNSSRVSLLLSKCSLTVQKISKTIKKQFVLLYAITRKMKHSEREKQKYLQKWNKLIFKLAKGPWTPSCLSTELFNKRNLEGSFKTSFKSCYMSKRPGYSFKQT